MLLFEADDSRSLEAHLGRKKRGRSAAYIPGEGSRALTFSNFSTSALSSPAKLIASSTLTPDPFF